MSTTAIIDDSGLGEKEIVQVESTSRPGLMHFVDASEGFCSCEHYVYTGQTCRHVRIARIRRAKRGRRVETEARYGIDSDHGRFGEEGLYHVIEVRNGERRRITTAGTYDAAAKDVRDLRAGNEAGRRLLAQAAERRAA